MSMACRVAVVILCAGLACTEPSTVRVLATEPAWLSWPAEVRAAQPFDVRFVFYAPGCFDRMELRVYEERGADHIAFRGEWLVEGESDPLCLRSDPGFVATLVTLAGLAATGDSTYEVRPIGSGNTPPRPVGTILVRATGVLNTDHLSGLGHVVGSTDIEGCAVMQPPFEAPVPVENPPAAQWLGYVHGYFFTPAAPLCGQTRVFHVTTGP